MIINIKTINNSIYSIIFCLNYLKITLIFIYSIYYTVIVPKFDLDQKFVVYFLKTTPFLIFKRFYNKTWVKNA